MVAFRNSCKLLILATAAVVSLVGVNFVGTSCAQSRGAHDIRGRGAQEPSGIHGSILRAACGAAFLGFGLVGRTRGKALWAKGGEAETKQIESASKAKEYMGTQGLVWGMSGDFGPWPGLVGATMPLVDPSRGMDRWDPLNLSKDDPVKFDRYRGAELKHGRVAMLAVVGLLVQHWKKLPYIITGDGENPAPSLENVPTGFGALTTYPASVGFAFLFLLAGWVELVFWKQEKDKAPGDFGDPAGLQKRSIFPIGTDFNAIRTLELEHGRLAMMGFWGAMSAEWLTGKDAVQQWALFS